MIRFPHPARLLALTGVLVTVCLPLPAAEQGFDPVRKSRVGASRHVRVRSLVSSEGRMFKDGGETLVLRKRREIEFVGQETVLAIDAQGFPTKLRIQVRKLSHVEDGKERNDIPLGSEFVLTFVPKAEVFYADGRDLPRSQARTLGALFKRQFRGAHDALLFGARGRKAPGDKWDATNPRAVADLFLKSDQVDLAAASSSTEFVAEESVAGVDCRRVRFSLQSKNARSPIPLPVTMRVKDLDYSVVFEGVYPVDSSKARLAMTMRKNVDLVVKGSRSPDDEHPTLVIKAREIYETAELPGQAR